MRTLKIKKELKRFPYFCPMKKLLFAFCLFGLLKTYAQEITVQGNVVDDLGSKAIKAKIKFKSYPTGGITGNFNDSTFSFAIFGSSKYQITAEAEGYIPRTVNYCSERSGQWHHQTRYSIDLHRSCYSLGASDF